MIYVAFVFLIPMFTHTIISEYKTVFLPVLFGHELKLRLWMKSVKDNNDVYITARSIVWWETYLRLIHSKERTKATM